MKLSEFYALCDGLAPKTLSDEYCQKYGAYDNSGILVDTGEEVRGALFSLDLSFAAIDCAIEKGFNLIVIHHPAIYGKIGDIRATDFQPIGKKLIKCISHGISVIAMHLNLDCAEGGVDESLMQGVMLSAALGGFDGAASVGLIGAKAEHIMHPLSVGGYGRVYDIQKTTLSALAEGMKKVFSTGRVLVYGADRPILRAASFCGSGADEEAVEFAVQSGAQVMISSDFKHHVLTLAEESGLAVIVLTHYASENYGFEKYYEKLRRQVSVPCAYHTDKSLL